MDTSADAAGSETIFRIELINGWESIKEIYYADGKGSVFSYKQTKKALFAVLIFTVLSGLFYALSFSNQVAWIFLLFLTASAAIVSLLIFSLQAKKYFEWKIRIDAYLKEVAKYEKQSLSLSAYSFELINADETIIEKWKSISKASFSPIRILLNSESGSHYLFPAKSMEDSEYQALEEFIRQKMNDPATIEETT